jgi:hypothetical protein
MQLKPGVRVVGVKPEIVLAMSVADSVFRSIAVEMVVTACIDGQHKAGSLHYPGLAFDARSHDLEPALRQKVRDGIAAALGPDFDVLFEDPGTPNEHLHVEFQPKLPYTA